MKLYDVDGYDRPLLLSEEHAEVLGAKERAALTRPGRHDPKAAWVDYAVAQGMDPTVAETTTKADLQATYGG